ncbi:hypothetical protein PIB30_068699, partial [Stylosanthes scabra]|nr:hypothetical protein [Stylosanthes scabra]
MGLSASKRVKSSLSNSAEFDSVWDSTSRSKSKSGDAILGPVMFKEWVLELYTDAVLFGAGKVLLLRVPVNVAGIAGIGEVTHAGGQVVGTVVRPTRLAL